MSSLCYSNINQGVAVNEIWRWKSLKLVDFKLQRFPGWVYPNPHLKVHPEAKEWSGLKEWEPEATISFWPWRSKLQCCKERHMAGNGRWLLGAKMAPRWQHVRKWGLPSENYKKLNPFNNHWTCMKNLNFNNAAAPATTWLQPGETLSRGSS